MTEDPPPRYFPQCPYQMPGIAVDCPFNYGWRWFEQSADDIWMRFEYMVEAWVRWRTAQGAAIANQPPPTRPAPPAPKPSPSEPEPVPRQEDPCGGKITTLPVLGNGDLAVPAPGTNQGDPHYGSRPGGHWGIDFANDAHALVVAAGDGTIFRQDFRDSKGFGGQVIIDHGGNIYTQYGHLEIFLATEKASVDAGDAIGRTAVPGQPGSGNLGTGMSPQVHFEIRLGSPLAESVGGTPINPQVCLPK